MKKYITALLMCMLTINVVYVNKITQSPLGQGTMNLIKDITAWLMVLSPVVAGLMVIGHLIYKKLSAHDDMESTKSTKAIKKILICTVLVFVASATISLLVSYFQVSA